MVCVNCGAETRVINSRLKKRLNIIWRRRICNSCGTLFTTGESADYSLVWAVKNKKGDISPFSRDKLFLSLYKALGHRKTAMTDASAIAETVIGNLIANKAKGSALERDQIKNACAVALNRFDKPAFTLYQAFHK